MNKKDFEKLKIGQIITNKKDKQAFIITQIYPERVIATRTIGIDDPTHWDVEKDIRDLTIEEALEECKKWKLTDSEMAEMSGDSIKECATQIAKTFQNNDWYHSIGIGDNELVIYTRKKKFVKPFESYGGFKVSFHYLGTLAP